MEPADAAPSVDVANDDPSFVISTAATEGVPRGAVLTHRNILTAGHETIALLGLSADTRCLGVLPLFHILGLGLALETLQVGGACVLMERFDAAAAAGMVDEFDVTMLAVFPPMLQMLLDARVENGATFDSLKYVFGLEGPEIIQRLQTETSADFWFGFGQSETSGGVTIVRSKDRPGSAGLPYSSARLRCVDEEGEDVPVGEPGEIVVQGPMVFQGYWRDPDATEYALRQGWHHTGDVGKFDDEGYLYYVGRKPEKELIKSGGENVYPAEVEQVLQELPQIEAVCVIGVSDAKWGEAVKAVIELSPGTTLSEDEIGAAVKDKIASYKKPRFVEFVDSLPRAESGDIDRAAVKSVHG